MFSFVLNKVFVDARKHNTKKKKKWLYFVHLQLTSPKQTRKKVFILFFTLCFIASIKNIKQNTRENIVECWFYETCIKILRPN